MMTPGRFRKRPVVIEAMRWIGPQGMPDDYSATVADLRQWGARVEADLDMDILRVWNAPEMQWINCPPGHWIIKGVRGEFYPCDPEIFEATYEAYETV